MEWIERLNNSITYLETHLTEEIDYGALAQLACCSAYHYQRMFTYLAGMPLSEYIRRRRMSLAAVDLRSGGEKIVDIALKYGYASPTAFNRAFQRVHGVSPSAVRRGEAAVKAYPPIHFKIIIQGVTEMEYRIEKHEAFRIVGLSEQMSADLEENFEVVPQLWGRLAAEGNMPRLIGLMDGEPKGLLGVSVCCDSEDWRYLIAVASGQPAPEGMDSYEIPAFTWAVFPGEGACPAAIQELEKRVVTEWLPTSGYEYDNGPDLEVYLTPDPQNAKFEVWIPVVKKASLGGSWQPKAD